MQSPSTPSLKLQHSDRQRREACKERSIPKKCKRNMRSIFPSKKRRKLTAFFSGLFRPDVPGMFSSSICSSWKKCCFKTPAKGHKRSKDSTFCGKIVSCNVVKLYLNHQSWTSIVRAVNNEFLSQKSKKTLFPFLHSGHWYSDYSQIPVRAKESTPSPSPPLSFLTDASLVCCFVVIRTNLSNKIRFLTLPPPPLLRSLLPCAGTVF